MEDKEENVNLKVEENNELITITKRNKIELNNLELNAEFKQNDKKVKGKIVTGVDYAPQLRQEYSNASLRSEKLDAILKNTSNRKEDSDSEFEL